MLQLHLRRPLPLICCVILAFIFSKNLAHGAGLRLQLASSQSQFSRGEIVFVRVSIENMSPETVYVYSVLVPNSDPARGPESRLTFDIIKPDGRKAAFVGMKSTFDPPAIILEGFREMPPLSFFGQFIPLNERQFAYEINKPGVYRVKARIALNGNLWLGAEKERHKGKKKSEYAGMFPFKDHVAGGELESNEVTFVVK